MWRGRADGRVELDDASDDGVDDVNFGVVASGEVFGIMKNCGTCASVSVLFSPKSIVDNSRHIICSLTRIS